VLDPRCDEAIEVNRPAITTNGHVNAKAECMVIHEVAGGRLKLPWH